MVQASFEMRAKQSLALTPRLQQSVKLLQLSALEFAQELQQALASNPFLEEDDTDGTADPDGFNEQIPANQSTGISDAASETEALPEEQATELIEVATEMPTNAELDQYTADASAETSADYADEYGASRSGKNAHDGEAGDVGEWARSMQGLHQYLHEQLRSYRLSERDHALAGMVIEALDEDGYLRQDLNELAAQFPFDPPVCPTELPVALNLVQQLDPPGIAARDLAECLMLQLQAKPAETPGRELALVIVRTHLPLLAKRDYAALQRVLYESEINAACNLIFRLDPKPGLRFNQVERGYIIPDVIVRKIKGVWTASINPAVMPRTRLHHAYADLFHRAGCSDRSPMAQQLQEARWLIRNVEQRFVTILRVAECIVTYQRTFFEYGDIAMKPMILRHVADELGLHESTVSRATSNKYMTTPKGIFEFKHFFSRELITESGGACSPAAVRALLKEMIAEENCREPLSDVSLTRMLAEQGVVVARRTVTKYRYLMKVPPAELRRQVA